MADEANVASQVDRVAKELETTPDSYLRTYVLSKAKEFESLRKSYETQLDWAKAEIRRLGTLADGKNFEAARAGRIQRDKEWLGGMSVLPGMRVAVVAGLVDIPTTVKMLVDRMNPKEETPSEGLTGYDGQ
jgi:hypothetical protein